MWLIEIVSTEGFTPKTCGQFVDRIYSTDGEAVTTNGKELQNPNKLVVAATCEVAKT